MTPTTSPSGSPSDATPFATGSVSLRCYPHLDLPAPAIVEELRAQAALAVEHGFDGVMTSEHHGGFAGYLPNPLQTAAFALERDAVGLGRALPPAPAAAADRARDRGGRVARGARPPGRVGLGVAAGALPVDFEIMGTTMDDLTARFAPRSGVTACGRWCCRARSRATPPSRSAGEHPIPVRERGRGAPRRLGGRPRPAPGSCSTHCRRPTAAARSSTRTAPRAAAVRACSSGAHGSVSHRRSKPPRQLDVYRDYTPAGAAANWGADELGRPHPTRPRSRSASSTRPGPRAPTR